MACRTFDGMLGHPKRPPVLCKGSCLGEWGAWWNTWPLSKCKSFDATSKGLKCSWPQFVASLLALPPKKLGRLFTCCPLFHLRNFSTANLKWHSSRQGPEWGSLGKSDGAPGRRETCARSRPGNVSMSNIDISLGIQVPSQKVLGPSKPT